MKLSRTRSGVIALAFLAGFATLSTAPASAITQVTPCPDYYSVDLVAGVNGDNYCYTDPGFVALNLYDMRKLLAFHWGGHFWYNDNTESVYFSAGQVLYYNGEQGSALRIY
jgi:hypothetical protein